MAEDVLKALQDEAAYFKVNKDGKLECILNNHAFPPRLDVIKAFISGKKYQTLKKRKNVEVSLNKYEPFLTQSINFPSMLFCSLTNQLIDKSLDRIKQHMQGRRFLNAKDRYMKDEMELWEEPTLEDDFSNDDEKEKEDNRDEEEDQDNSMSDGGHQGSNEHQEEEKLRKARPGNANLESSGRANGPSKRQKQK